MARNRKTEEEMGTSAARDTCPYSVEWKRVSVASLHEDPANARKHGTRNRATVRASLARFGQVQTLAVEAGTGRVLGGNCTLGELRALGVEEVQVCEVGVHGRAARELAAVLNRSAELAEWDDDVLGKLLADLDADEAAAIGWDEDELEALLAEPAVEPPPSGAPDQSAALVDQYRILVECETEGEQLDLLARFEKEGIKCRAYML